MTARKISRIFGLVLLCAQLATCPAYAEDWLLPRTEQLFWVRHTDPEECRAVLGAMVPDVSISVVGKRLRVRGQPGAIDQVKELMAELDSPSGKVMLDVRLLAWERSLAKLIGLVFQQEGPLLAASTIPPCSGDSYTQFRFVETQGNLDWLGSKRVVTRLGRPVELELRGGGLELALDVEVALGARRHIETTVRMKGLEAPPGGRVTRLVADGGALIITGFADHQPLRLEESEEFVLVLVPYLMR